MSVDRRFANTQARRLRFCKYFVQADGEEYFAEITSALMRAKNDVVAAMVIDEWLVEQTERPAPADIHRLVRKHNGVDEEPVFDLGTPPTEAEMEEHRAWVREMEKTLAKRKLA